MRKPDFCICENKDADQLRGNREADQRLCFRYIVIILGRSFTAGLRINLVNKYKQDNLPFTNTYLVLHHHFPQFSKKQPACSLSTLDICRHVVVVVS